MTKRKRDAIPLGVDASARKRPRKQDNGKFYVTSQQVRDRLDDLISMGLTCEWDDKEWPGREWSGAQTRTLYRVMSTRFDDQKRLMLQVDVIASQDPETIPGTQYEIQ